MIQMIGRGLRKFEPDRYPGQVKSDCIVLDFGTSVIMKMYYRQYCQLCAEFGITPSARTRIIGPGAFVGEESIPDEQFGDEV